MFLFILLKMRDNLALIDFKVTQSAIIQGLSLWTNLFEIIF